MRSFRIGYGYDAHKLVDNRKFIIGGVEIPYHKGLLGHSDADVLIHAICDALLGSLALGDIGEHFPDTSKVFENIDSAILLKKTISLIRDKGYDIVNIDTTIRAQKPKLTPYIEAMRARIASIIDMEIDCVSIKASTTEKMGFEGREEGISASCIVLIHKI